MSLDLNALVKNVTITDTKGKIHPLTGNNPEAQIDSINIYESMDLFCMCAEIVIIDTAINLIGTAPIVGTEIIDIELSAPNISEQSFKWQFVVAAIRNRIVSRNIQAYVLECWSVEALRNETLRVTNTLADYPHKIVDNLIRGVLGSSKNILNEPCANQLKYIPSLQRPFDVIDGFSMRCLSGQAKTPSQGTTSSTSSTTSSSSTSVAGGQSQIVKSANEITGTAGYKFFETLDGFVFKSLDLLITENPNKHREYTYGMAQDERSNSKDNSFLILNYSFQSQEDIHRKMRTGVYSSMLCTFNPSTCEYQEYFFNLEKEYAKMVHLGTDTSIPDNIKKLSQYPSRVMLQVYDHETYYGGVNVADPEKLDGGTPYPDYSKQWLAQSISRNMILKNQILNITIPINFNIRAGDKLNVKLPNQSVQSKREQQLYDMNNSGLYLVSSIAYNIERDNNRGLIAVCNLQLIRDNLGSKV